MDFWRFIHTLSTAALFAAVTIPRILGGQDTGPHTPAELPTELATHSGGICPGQDSFSLERPDPAGQPTEVAVALYFNDIVHLDDVERSLRSDVYLVLRWKDSRLADSDRGEGGVPCTLPMDLVWHPAVAADRMLSLSRLYPDIKLVDEDGVVTWVRRLLVDLSVSLDLEEFPFDEHELSFRIYSVVAGADEMVFRVWEEFTGRADDIKVSGWEIGDVRAEVVSELAPRRSVELSSYYFKLGLQREWKYFLYKLIVPLTLIVFMSGTVFLLPASSVVSQISVAVTSMLTLIAYQFALANMLPRISYLTRADHFILGSTVLVFTSLAKAVWTAMHARAQRAGEVEKLDSIGRVAFPLLFCAIVLAAFVL